MGGARDRQATPDVGWSVGRVVERIARRGLLATLVAGAVCGMSMTHADDDFLRAYGETYRFRLGRPGQFTLTPDGKTLLFRRGGPRSFEQDLWALDPRSGEERLLLTAQQVLQGAEEQLSEAEKARRERQRQAARGIASYTLFPDGRSLLIPLSGKLYRSTILGDVVRELGPAAGGVIDPQLSPDGKWIAYARGRELYLMDAESGEERALTRGAPEGVTRGQAEFVAQEEMSRNHGFWWSPDSRRILYQETDTSGLEVMKIADAKSPAREPSRWAYPRPGQANADVRLKLLDVAQGSTREVEWKGGGASEYVAAVQWSSAGPLTVVTQNRQQTVHRLLRVDPANGSTHELLVERDDAWVEIDQAVPRWIDGGERFLWTTERGGAPQLELRAADGSPIRFLTDVDFGFRNLERVDELRGRALVRASSDPTAAHLWWVDLDSKKPKAKRLTREVGLHDAVSSGAPFVVVDSGPDRGRRYRLYDAGGPTGVGITSNQAAPPNAPRPEFVKVGPKPGLHAVVLRPEGFRSGRKYPVIVHVYGGPTSQMVQRDRDRYALPQWMADQGYVVVSIDGRGTPGRDREWTRAVKLDLIEKPLADQVAGVKALGAKFPEMDLERVGMFGWSFGGYFSAMAVMRRPDVFKAGVAGAPVVDWLDYDTHYTERYLDTPQNNPAGYEASNVLTYADGLRRPLMLIHGTADDNVYLVHSLKLADALLREGKSFEFLPLPGHTHAVRDPDVVAEVWRRAFAFLDRQLAVPVRH